MAERKYMSDREILEKYTNIDNMCLQEEEKEEEMKKQRNMIWAITKKYDMI